MSYGMEHDVSHPLYELMIESRLDLFMTLREQPKDDDARPENKSATKRRLVVMFKVSS